MASRIRASPVEYPKSNVIILRQFVKDCYYHPAPLTKRSKPTPGPEDEQERPKKRQKATSRTGLSVQSASTESVGASQFSSPNNNLDSGLTTGQNAYLGSTSFLSIFHDTVPQLSNLALQPLPPEFARWQNKHLSLQSQLLKLLSAFDLYERLIEDYYKRGLFTIIPAPLILDALRFARTYLENEDTSNSKQKNLYRKISQNTAKPLQISPTATAEEFCQSFTAENLRWEFIGVIFALAGLSLMSALTQACDKLALRFGDGEVLSETKFAAQMLAASNDVIEICRQHDKVNDIMIWLEYTHCVLNSTVLDETSHLVYRGFGNLISDMFAMGFHREQPPGPGIPFFLSQTRKRIFMAAYRSDKNIATLLGRPPRIQQFYCDITLPLDLDDESLLLTGEELTAAIQKLDADGWNPERTQERRFRSTSVIRLRKIYQECQNLWVTIPLQFRYDVNCWKTLEPITCVAMLVIYLEYLHSLFQIQRILCQQNLAESSSLLSTSMQLLSTVLHLLKQPEPTPEMQTNFSWIFLFYGLPAAGVLASELYQSTLSALPWPASSTPPRSQIIRDLDMIISWFETTTLPPSATSRVCVEITKVLSRLLDDTLNYHPSQQQQQQVASQVEDAESKPEDTTSAAVEAATAPAVPSYDNGRQDTTRCQDEQISHQQQQQVSHLPEQASMQLPVEISEMGLGINDQFTSEKFLSWLDDLDWDSTVPDLLF
ncbi:hypothetical protein PRK78_005943 [Emydomyces testavorans]|uniref:Xylanolytic transcriptional activator regulatory domain-containing protein n=1 Tax=Emydomyces testavorans TaxID=2070801 RepID=A0AAF0DML8_9EURO|nr:hypothetical protein PRK78_005943 [Emydomyces testavorans]